jgi:hypothetical protein
MPGKGVGVMVGVGRGGWVGEGQGVRVGGEVGEAGAGVVRAPWQAARSSDNTNRVAMGMILFCIRPSLTRSACFYDLDACSGYLVPVFSQRLIPI